MISAQSHRCRRVVARLERGSELIRSILAACGEANVRSGEVRASGWLEDAELLEPDPEGKRLRPGRRLGPPLQLVQLRGLIAEQEGALQVTAHAILSRETDGGLVAMGGVIAKARVLLVEIVIESFDDLLLRRGVDERSGLPGLTEALALMSEAAPESSVAAPSPVAAAPTQAHEDARLLADKQARLHALRDGGPAKTTGIRSAEATPPPAPRGQSAADWEAVKAASDEADEADDATEQPRRGDFVDHATFGRCVIERFEDGQARISVRVRRSNRLVELSLEHISLVPAGKEGTTRLFRALVRRDIHR